MSTTNKDIALRIKELRLEVGVTQDRIAELIGLSRPVVSFIESGERRVRADELVIIATELNARTDWLLYGTGRRFRRAA